MIYLIVIVLGIGTFEVINMLKKDLKRETIVYIVMAIVTLAFGLYYLSNPFPDSLSYLLLKLFGLEY